WKNELFANFNSATSAAKKPKPLRREFAAKFFSEDFWQTVFGLFVLCWTPGLFLLYFNYTYNLTHSDNQLSSFWFYGPLALTVTPLLVVVIYFLFLAIPAVFERILSSIDAIRISLHHRKYKDYYSSVENCRVYLQNLCDKKLIEIQNKGLNATSSLKPLTEGEVVKMLNSNLRYSKYFVDSDSYEIRKKENNSQRKSSPSKKLNQTAERPDVTRHSSQQMRTSALKQNSLPPKEVKKILIVNCPCGAKLQINSQQRGTVIKCGKCGQEGKVN
ncbi:MAG: hypothetical protein GY818_00280, partial [Planctomycetaceae bacterium]|nr:hypothetical protein [Planctomycetaceae bacterium]